MTDKGRFTDRARTVLQLAQQEAQRFRHDYIGTEHVLLGLIKEGRGVAANVLKNLDVDLRLARIEVEKLVEPSPDPEAPTGKLPHTPRTKRVLEYAIEEARLLGHNYVGTEHLLLGLIRTEDGVAAQVLLNLKVSVVAVRQEILLLLGQNPETGESPDPKTARATFSTEQRKPTEAEALHTFLDAVGGLARAKKLLFVYELFLTMTKDSLQQMMQYVADMKPEGS